MSAWAWFVVGALCATLPFLALTNWLLDRLHQLDRRNAAWQEECRALQANLRWRAAHHRMTQETGHDVA